MFCLSHRSRDEERSSKPGAMSTPVKSSDDGVLSQASDQASSRDDKSLPPLPGTALSQLLIRLLEKTTMSLQCQMSPTHKDFNLVLHNMIICTCSCDMFWVFWFV